MRLSAKQKWSIQQAQRRLNIWEGAVRSSKTWGSLIRWVQFVGREADPHADLILLGRTERTVYRNVIKPLELLCGNAARYTYGRGELMLLGRLVHVFGANDERSEGKLRGMTAAGAYGDECTIWPEAVFKMMLSRLSADNAKFFGTTNCDSPYHYLKTEYIDRAHELDMFTSHWILDDNPFISPAFKANLKKEYRGLWYKRFIEGLWVMAEGAVYDFWDDAEHVITAPPVSPTGSKTRYGVAIDYGTGNPTCFILFGFNKNTRPQVWAEREYYYDSTAAGRQKTDAEYSKDLRKWLRGVVPEVVVVDPSAASLKVQLQQDGFFFIRDAINDVLDGIRTQARLLGLGIYAVMSCCEHTIQDYSAYLWDKNAQKRGEDKPMKQHDHTKDTERYFLHTIFGQGGLDYTALTTA